MSYAREKLIASLERDIKEAIKRRNMYRSVAKGIMGGKDTLLHHAAMEMRLIKSYRRVLEAQKKRLKQAS